MPRAELLNGVVDHIAANGLGDASLRSIAAAVGTSHRMLIHHFGGMEGLLVAVVQEVERRTREAFADLDGDPEDVMRSLWDRLADPAMWPLERVFFEMYGAALAGRPGTTGLLDDIVGSWVRPVTELGFDETDARLALAVCRGLLLDLLATEDRDGVDRAAIRFQSMLLRRDEDLGAHGRHAR